MIRVSQCKKGNEINEQEHIKDILKNLIIKFHHKEKRKITSQLYTYVFSSVFPCRVT